MHKDIQDLILQMTLEEKASLCSGFDFWHTKPIPRLGIPPIMVADGPHGLRKQKEDSDHLGLHDSVPATCFPSGATVACSWDRTLIKEIGMALGEECQAENVSVLLGPAANIKRSPLCGRNFEYFSEDPYLSSEMGASYIEGVQSQGVGTSLKHFAANNQEHRRMSIDAIVDERTLREIYLASFETAVKRSKPWTVMCAYNRLNGDFCSENKFLLTDILREEWGHVGFVMSDWGAVNDRVDGLEAGLELEMPGNGGLRDWNIVEAVRSGKLPEEVLDRAVERLLTVIFKAVGEKKENASYDREEHHQLARKAACESIVLLRNEDSVLPLKKEGTIAVIGEFIKSPRYQGGGSSHVQPTSLDDFYDEIRKVAGEGVRVLYADGYSLENDNVDEQLIDEARQTAIRADVAVVFAGLPERYESEGYDREHISIPENHLRLIEAVADVQPNVVVVLSNGSPVEMPWLHRVKGILETYLGGQALGGAIADILFGHANPCGKLAETFPKQLSHNPSYLNFPGKGDKVEYKEGLFVGYRYYDAKDIEPLFPFGYGLSYTGFEYSRLFIDKDEIMDCETVTVSVNVKNIGSVVGKEIVQLYVGGTESSIIRPKKELKGFAKVELQPGEEKTVRFTLEKRSFAYYDIDLKDWQVESGDYDICIGKSSREIVLTTRIRVQSSASPKQIITPNSLIGDLMADPDAAPIVQQLLHDYNEKSGLMESLKDNPEMAMAMMKYMPLRGLTAFGQGRFTDEMIARAIEQLMETMSKRYVKN
ncbi:glycoside hydrolase family 3 C-terminal domain-containing protein [Fodinisporobacter ferrooxydans]|uniref:Glycoside hydrolase family 3 C-terminal domain-containing protein n=1 Tax=Fodinisporobacter ferrooxydans TaxID=2901836 RepID=A0ABY4CFC4_9BACL|nr:glycoside hydrolase family 3 C-terminal domain-containing protein [Alicyclobacillaceae bacterium MYW30-H2]